MVLYGILLFCTVCYFLLWYVSFWYGKLLFGIIWYFLVQYVSFWYGMLRHPNKGPGPHRPAAPAPPTADGGKSAARAKRKNPSRRAGPQAYPLLAISSLSSCSSSSSSFTLYFFLCFDPFLLPNPLCFPLPFFSLQEQTKYFLDNRIISRVQKQPKRW